MLRLGLIGAGRIGRIHGSNVQAQAGARLAAVTDADARETGAEAASVDAILGSAEIDAILICTPTDTHADLVERGARRSSGRSRSTSPRIASGRCSTSCRTRASP